VVICVVSAHGSAEPPPFVSRSVSVASRTLRAWLSVERLPLRVAAGGAVEQLVLDMKRVRVAQYVEAPINAAESGSSALFDLATPIVAGHPALIRFAPGMQQADFGGERLSVTAEQDKSAGKIRLNLSAGGDVSWYGALTPASEYMIAVVDKANGTARIVEAAGESCFTRKVALNASATGEETQAVDARTYREKRGDLLGEFGGKRAKDRQAKMERNAITDERVSTKAAAQLDDIIEAHQQVKAAGGSGTGTTRDMAPPHNMEAKRVEDAYPLLGLMTSLEYNYLNIEAERLIRSLRRASSDNPGWHSVCWDLIRLACKTGKHARGSKEESASLAARKGRVIAAMYLHCLISIMEVPSRRIGDRECTELLQKTAVPEDVLDSLLIRFTEVAEGNKNDRFKSNASDARLTYFAVVLWLTANDFTVASGIDEVASALGLGRSQLLVHCKYLGCTLKRVAEGDGDSKQPQGVRVSLQAPLVFPPLKQVRNTPRKGR
jgi:hypothetical protein